MTRFDKIEDVLNGKDLDYLDGLIGSSENELASGSHDDEPDLNSDEPELWDDNCG